MFRLVQEKYKKSQTVGFFIIVFSHSTELPENFSLQKQMNNYTLLVSYISHNVEDSRILKRFIQNYDALKSGEAIKSHEQMSDIEFDYILDKLYESKKDRLLGWMELFQEITQRNESRHIFERSSDNEEKNEQKNQQHEQQRKEKHVQQHEEQQQEKHVQQHEDQQQEKHDESDQSNTSSDYFPEMEIVHRPLQWRTLEQTINNLTITEDEKKNIKTELREFLPLSHEGNDEFLNMELLLTEMEKRGHPDVRKLEIRLRTLHNVFKFLTEDEKSASGIREIIDKIRQSYSIFMADRCLKPSVLETKLSPEEQEKMLSWDIVHDKVLSYTDTVMDNIKTSTLDDLKTAAVARLYVIDNEPRAGEYASLKKSIEQKDEYCGTWLKNYEISLNTFKTRKVMGTYKFDLTRDTEDLLYELVDRGCDGKLLDFVNDTSDWNLFIEDTFETITGVRLTPRILKAMCLKKAGTSFVDKATMAYRMGITYQEMKNLGPPVVDDEIHGTEKRKYEEDDIEEESKKKLHT